MLKHKNTRKLFDHWRSRRVSEIPPHRTMIEPAALTSALGGLFILEPDAKAGTAFVFRLAGSRFCAMTGRELTASQPQSLIIDDHKQLFDQGLRAVAQEQAIMVLDMTGLCSTNRSVQIEALMLPITAESGHIAILGAIEPLAVPVWLDADPIAAFTIDSVRMLDVDRELFCLQNRPAIAIGSKIAPRRQLSTPPQHVPLSVIEGRSFQRINTKRPELRVLDGGKRS